MATPAARASVGGVPPLAAGGRRPFRDNPRLILAGIVLLLGVLASLVWLANRSAQFAPDFLTGFVLYALSATNVTMLLALGFFLVRNVVKIVVERRRALPFARFRAKLVALLLGLTLVPSLLVLAVGSQVVLTAVDRWFNAPMEEVLASASRIASDYYLERQRIVSDEAARIALALSTVDLGGDVDAVRSVVTPNVTGRRVALVQVYRVAGGSGAQPVLDVADPGMPAGASRAGGDLFHYAPTPRAAALAEHCARRGILLREFDAPPALRFGLPGSDAEWARLAQALDDFEWTRS